MYNIQITIESKQMNYVKDSKCNITVNVMRNMMVNENAQRNTFHSILKKEKTTA